ncbi:MAG: Hpt domain-containing protein [Victivallaceae bacterium]|nr:Hpt domain-containing protein [Victivallaceae bacterium]
MSINQVKQQITDYLRENMGLEDDGINELLAMLETSTADNIAKAEQKLSIMDFDALSRVGHSIKGSSANLGATDLAEGGKKLEFAAKDGDNARCQDALTELKEQLAQLSC